MIFISIGNNECCLCGASFFNVTTVSLISDIDECSKDGSPCDENAECFNNDGSYTCICKVGFTGNGTLCLGKPLHYEVICMALSLQFLFVCLLLFTISAFFAVENPLIVRLYSPAF